jgi:hypothetical protein
VKRLDHQRQAPGVDVVWPCLLQTLQACGVCGDRAPVCLADHLWSRGRTDHCRAPPEMGGPPGGPAGVAEVVSEQQGQVLAIGIFAPEAVVVDDDLTALNVIAIAKATQAEAVLAAFSGETPLSFKIS